MLAITITPQKIFAAASGSELTQLSFAGRPYINLDGKSAVQTLTGKLEAIQKAYREATQTQSSKNPIPTVVGYPLLPRHTDGAMGNLHAVKKFFLNPRASSSFSLIHAEPIHLAFLREYETAQGAGKKTVILEAMGDFVNLCYCKVPSGKVNGRTLETDSVRHLTYEKLGHLPTVKHLVEEVSKKITGAGLKLEGTDRGDLERQISETSSHKGPKERVYTISKKNNGVKIQAEVTLTEDQYEKTAAVHIGELRKELQRKTLDSLGVDQVLLMGPFFKNKVVQNYLSKDLQLGDRVKPFPSTEVDKIMRGLVREGSVILTSKKEEEKKRKEMEAKQKALAAAKELQINREKFIAEIATSCTNPAAVAEYEKKFIPKGAAFNVPAEVVKWNIQEAVKRVELNISAPIPAVSAVTPKAATPSAQSASKAAATPKTKSIRDFFRVEGVLHDPEFESRKVFLHNDSQPRSLRLLSTAKLADPRQQEGFLKLYQKELSYYQELSEIGQAAEGKYYHRAFIPRDTLKNYIKRTGLANKTSFEKLNSKDIKLVAEVLEEIKGMPVSHADLSEHNILIIREKGWRNAGYQIKIIGFTTEDCSNDEMVSRVHDIFERSLRPGVYTALRKNLNL